MRELVPAREIKPGDKILAESPRYHGPTFTVDTRDLTVFAPDTYRITGRWGSEGQHPATLTAVPGGKRYMVERAPENVPFTRLVAGSEVQA